MIKLKPKKPKGLKTPPMAQLKIIFVIIVLLSILLSVRQTSMTGRYIAMMDLVAPTNIVSLATETVTVAEHDSAEASTEKAGDIDKKAEPLGTANDIRNPAVSNNYANATSLAGTEAETFKRYDKVVIATKIHGNHQWKLVVQSMCLLHFSYNHKLLYDIVVFTALDNIPKESIEALEKMVAPAKITIVIDNIGFQEEIAALTPVKYDIFLKRCNVTDPVNLTWWSNCPSRLAYNWQAEFRSVRIWEHPALEKYKYMLWLDSDGFPSREWKKDPIGYFIENKGVIMFDNFPQGRASSKMAQQYLDAFNTTVCNLKMNTTGGHLQRSLINQNEYDAMASGKSKVNCNTGVQLIHGFMHITDLDFYRQPKVLNGLKSLLGNCFLCRTPDDQLAVTIPAAIYAPEKSWDMRLHGFDLKVYHNMKMDGKEKVKTPTDNKQPPTTNRGFVTYWKLVGSKEFPTADKVCGPIITEQYR